jgi:N-acetylglucosamine kinase-like BadF-type ATPase
MKRYLALDAGGTKVAAVLYNDDFEQIGAVVSGSLRENTTSRELVEKHIGQLIEGLGLDGGEIEEVCGICEKSLIERIKTICHVKNYKIAKELELGLSAAGIFGDGMLALSGTGASLFCRFHGEFLRTGSYGAPVADEGSGYWIGRNAFLAAIRDDEERGPRTLLTDLIPRHLGFKGREELGSSIFSIYGNANHSPVACVARCAPIVTEAAKMGDAVASEILRDAGRLLAEQLLYLIRKHSLPDNLPLTISGSVWRGDRLIFDTFCSLIKAQCPSRTIIVPVLEPVLGVIARHYHGRYGHFNEKDVALLAGNFPDFTFELDKPKPRG